MDDSNIIALFFARVEQAITELIKKHGAAVRKMLNNILNDRRDVEECEDDTYLATWNTIPPENPNPLVTYVCKIGRNLAIKKYHANTAQKRNSAYDAALDELEEYVPALESVESEYDAKELSESISAFLDTCNEDDRFLFVRRYWYADPITEIAAATDKSDHWVSVRLFRIREKLQAHLEKEGMLL